LIRSIKNTRQAYIEHKTLKTAHGLKHRRHKGKSTGEIVMTDTGETIKITQRRWKPLPKNMPSPPYALTFEKHSCVSATPSAPNQQVEKRPQVGLRGKASKSRAHVRNINFVSKTARSHLLCDKSSNVEKIDFLRKFGTT